MKEQDIYKLQLFEEVYLHHNPNAWECIKRVPGGWIYSHGNSNGESSAFIPFNNEFQEN